MIEENNNDDNKEVDLIKNQETDKTNQISSDDMQNDNLSEKKDIKQNEKEEIKMDENNKNVENSNVPENTENKSDEVEVKEGEKSNLNENQTDDTESKSNESDLKEEEKNNIVPDSKWYIVQAHSGAENKAVETIKFNAKKKSLLNFFEDFKVPTHEVMEMKRGKKVTSEKKFFPGYILIKMVMNNDTWQLVKKSNKVSAFVGNDHQPVPLSEIEAMKMLKKADDTINYTAPQLSFEVGEQVKVSDGPFASFNGTVEEIDEDKSRLKVSVSIFGRSTPVELDYAQVEKM